jgi:hypothetical protein
MNKIKPILFNTAMVGAILGGRKTQTRRIMKLQPVENDFDGPYWFEPTITKKNGEQEPGEPIYGISANDGEWGIKCPYQPGDILWVRETWSKDENGEYVYRTNYGTTEDDSFPPSMFKWKPSIHMPREAARIFLKVTNVKVERVQDITAHDAIREGMESEIPFDTVDEFKELWDSIYAEPKAVTNKDDGILYYESYPWEDIQETREYKGKPWYVYGNPWVWVYEFEREVER